MGGYGGDQEIKKTEHETPCLRGKKPASYGRSLSATKKLFTASRLCERKRFHAKTPSRKEKRVKNRADFVNDFEY